MTEMKAKPARALVALLVLPALLLAACAPQLGARGAPAASGGGGATAGPAAVKGAVPAPGAPFGGSSVAVVPPAAQGGQTTQSAPLPIPVPQAFDGEKALVLTANIALRSDDAWGIADRVQSIATGLGGDVLALTQSGSKDEKSATLTIRVPQASFNDALRQIRGMTGVEVVSSGVTGQDVTDQFVDLQARLKAKQDEEQRYLALLARADKVDDILRIDSVLSQVRAQIEQLTGQVNSMKARTDYSTITVQISPAALVVPTPGPQVYDPSKTMEHAVAALASIMRTALDAAIWGLVFSWIPLVLFGLALVLGRVRGRALPTA
ncbi:MAG: DUF4349 domain-containing protein [Chloroflexota bacterium]|nr:DUF4349 domain-containing protein [Chloroflexota bacterium]